MGRLNRIVGKLVRKDWSPEQIRAMVGPWRDVWLGHAADPAVRETAASGGVVSALLIHMLDSGTIDGALLCTTVIEDGRVRPRYLIARDAEDVLAARGSTYIATRFARDAAPLIDRFDGKLAVVGLPCDLTWIAKARQSRPQIDERVVLTIGLLCGHSSQPELVDRLVERLEDEANSPIESFRFRVGHWRGRLRATFEDGKTTDAPFSTFSLYQNLYFFCDKKCLFCGDHFAFDADLVVGDVWRPELKCDPIKHSGFFARTDAGERAIGAALDTGAIEAEPMSVSDLVEGQARTAPFHYNVSARARAGKRVGIEIPDTTKAPVSWHEYLTARMVLANWKLSQSKTGSKLIFAMPRFALKWMLYLMKGLETLPDSVAADPTAPKPGPRVAIIAGTISGNRGAEAMLTTCIGRVREEHPDARFVAYSYYPESDRTLNLDPEVTVQSSTPEALVLLHFPFALLGGLFRVLRLSALVRFLPRTVRDLAGCDVLLDVAGVAFIDGREKFLPFNVLTIWPAMLLGVPVVKMSQALGPFDGTANRLAAKLFLPRCTRIFARGARTRENLDQLGLDAPPVADAADIAFSHEAEFGLSHENVDHEEKLLAALASMQESDRLVVGVCPSSVVASKAAARDWDYAATLAGVCDKAVEDGHAVLLFPNATRERSGEKLRNNDLPVIAETIAKLSPQTAESGAVIAVEHDLAAASIKHLLAACDVTLVSRFHAMVGSLACRVPVGVVGWSHKYLEVMDQFGLGEYVLDHSGGDSAAIAGLLDTLLAERPKIEAAIDEHLDSVRLSSASQFRFVNELLAP